MLSPARSVRTWRDWSYRSDADCRLPASAVRRMPASQHKAKGRGCGVSGVEIHLGDGDNGALTQDPASQS